MSDFIPPPEPPDDDAPASTVTTPRREDALDQLAADNIRRVEYGLLRQVCNQGQPDDDRSEAIRVVSPDDFTIGECKAVWECLREMDADRQPIDYVTLWDRLGPDRIHQLGGESVLVDLVMTWDFLAPTVTLAERVAEESRKRRLSEAGERVAMMAHTGHVDLSEVEDLLSPALVEHDRGVEGPWDVWEAIERRHAHPDAQRGKRIGWADLDPLYRVDPGLLSVVTGIPGSGKSSVVDAMCIRLAEREDWRFAVFSPESAPTDRHSLNLVSIHMGVNAYGLTIPQLHEQTDWVHNHFRWIKSTEEVELATVMRRADMVHRERPINGLVIDPWNELRHPRTDVTTETQHISDGLTTIRRWGRRNNVHVWLIAHPKKMEKRADGSYPAPSLYDISGSATWHDKADMGLVVHRDKQKPGPVDVHVVKVRFDEHGQIGTAHLQYDVPTGRYRNLARGSL